MVKMGFFAGLFGTMFEFYGGMFRLTFFLPFTLLQVSFQILLNLTFKGFSLQAWQLSRTKFIENLTEKSSQPELTCSSEETIVHDAQKPTTITWDMNAKPGQSILKHSDFREKEKRRDELNSEISDKLDKIGKGIEMISEILLRKETAKLEKKRMESQDDSNLPRRKLSIQFSPQERSRSLDFELERRSNSFQDLKKIFQEKGKCHSVLDHIPDETQEAKLENQQRKSEKRENIEQVESAPSTPVKAQKSSRIPIIAKHNQAENSKSKNSELGEKLELNKSVDKPSTRFLHGGSGRRKNKQKVNFLKKIYTYI